MCFVYSDLYIVDMRCVMSSPQNNCNCNCVNIFVIPDCVTLFMHLLLLCGFVLLGAFGGAAQALGPAIEASAGERAEIAAGFEADPVHA